MVKQRTNLIKERQSAPLGANGEGLTSVPFAPRLDPRDSAQKARRQVMLSAMHWRGT